MEGLKLKEISSTDSSNGVLGCLAGSVASSVTVLSRANLHQNSALNGIPDIDSQDREVDSGISDAYAEITTIQKIQAETITKIYQTYWLFFTFFLIWAVCATAFCHYLENKNDTIQDDDSEEEDDTIQNNDTEEETKNPEVTASSDAQNDVKIIPQNQKIANNLKVNSKEGAISDNTKKPGEQVGASPPGEQKKKKEGKISSFFKNFLKPKKSDKVVVEKSDKGDKEGDKEDVKESNKDAKKKA